MFQHILTLGLTLSNSVLPSKIEKPGKEGVGSESGNGIVEVDYTSICDECVPRAQIVAPAVGIELAATYGTVAIRYHNQTIINVGRINGSDEYIDVMSRAAPPYVNQGPPFDTLKEEIDWQLHLLKRQLRIARGLPADPDTEIISSMLYDLHLLASISSPVPILPHISVATPLMPNLLYSDFYAAFPWANLTETRSYVHPYRSYYDLLSKSFAGLGYGLCRSWANIQSCQSEERLFPVKQILAIEFTDLKLDISCSRGRTPIGITTTLYESFPSFGFQNHAPNPSSYWEGVKDRITTVLKASSYKPDTLIVLGERAGNKKFLDTVWEALGELGMRDIYEGLQVEGFDPEMVCARGAAELGKRAQGEPRGCMEGDWCRERREGEDGMGETKMGEDRTEDGEAGVRLLRDGEEQARQHELI